MLSSEMEAPTGQKLDTLPQALDSARAGGTPIGPSTRLLVSSTPPELLLRGEGAGTDLSRALEPNPAVTEGVLHVSVMAASCEHSI